MKNYRRRASVVPKVPRAGRPRLPTIPSEVSSAPGSVQPATTFDSVKFHNRRILEKILDSKFYVYDRWPMWLFLFPAACRANEISRKTPWRLIPIASPWEYLWNKIEEKGKSSLVFQRLRFTLGAVPSCWYTKWPSSSDSPATSRTKWMSNEQPAVERPRSVSRGRRVSTHEII